MWEDGGRGWRGQGGGLEGEMGEDGGRVVRGCRWGGGRGRGVEVEMWKEEGGGVRGGGAGGRGEVGGGGVGRWWEVVHVNSQSWMHVNE